MSVSHGKSEMKVTYSLDDKETNEIIFFLNRLKHRSHFNNPYWAELAEPYKKPMFVRFYEDGELSGFTIVYFRMSFCALHFGPLVLNQKKIPEYIDRVVNYLTAQGLGVLKIQLPFTRNFDFNSFFSNYKKLFSKISFNKNGWSTIIIPIANKTADEVFKTFRRDHRASVKKSIKTGVEVRVIQDKKILEMFSVIYDQMHHRKGLILPLPDSKTAFKKIIDFNLGVFAGVFLNNELLGGVIFVSEGDNLIYKYGATDVKYHDIPVLHLAIYEMIKYAIKTKHDNVDLCGYTLDAKEGSYSYGINMFKKGFGGDVIDFTPSFLIRLNYLSFFITRITLYLFNLIPENIKKKSTHI